MKEPPTPDTTLPLKSTLALKGWKDARLAADAWGEPDASPVLFLHGGGQTRQAWRRTAIALAREGWYAITMDMRGHGESEWVPDGDYSLKAFIADLEAVLAALPKDPAVVGASLGGLTALVAAGESASFRARVLVLVDVAPRIEAQGASRIVQFMMDRQDGFASLDEAARAVAEYTSNRERGKNLEGLKASFRKGADGRYRWHWDPRFISPSGPAEVGDKERLLRAAGNLQLPTLLVRGRLSDVLSEQGVTEFREAAPQAEFVDVSGAGHMVAGDRNDAFTEAVAAFLNRH